MSCLDRTVSSDILMCSNCKFSDIDSSICQTNLTGQRCSQCGAISYADDTLNCVHCKQCLFCPEVLLKDENSICGRCKIHDLYDSNEEEERKKRECQYCLGDTSIDKPLCKVCEKMQLMETSPLSVEEKVKKECPGCLGLMETDDESHCITCEQMEQWTSSFFECPICQTSVQLENEICAQCLRCF